MKKAYRIKKSQEFEIIIKNKRFFANPSMVLYIRKKAQESNRIGITVKKKVGNAVVRNKVKRQIRMMIQELYDFSEDFDTIILIKEKFVQNTYHENKNILETLYSRAKQVKIDK